MPPPKKGGPPTTIFGAGPFPKAPALLTPHRLRPVGRPGIQPRLNVAKSRVGLRHGCLPERDALTQLFLINLAKLAGIRDVSLADFQKIPVPDPTRRVHERK